MAISTQANVKRLIQIFAKQYEDNPRVVLRELIQNTADVITSSRKKGLDISEDIEVEIIEKSERSQYRVHLAVRDSKVVG